MKSGFFVGLNVPFHAMGPHTHTCTPSAATRQFFRHALRCSSSGGHAGLMTLL